MKIRQLEAFRAVIVTGSVTKAGELLHVSQPAVTQLLKQLEDRCGFLLFHRQANRVAPTTEATVLFEEVQRMFGSVEQVSRVAAALREGAWGTLRMAAFPSIGRRFLPEVVAMFCNDRPNLKVSIESRRSRSLIDWVATRQIDFGIGTLPGDRPDVISHHLKRLAGVCIMPPTHPLSAKDRLEPSDMNGEKFISLGSEDRSRLIIDNMFEEAKIARCLQIEAPQSDTACSLVEQGAGISIVDPFGAYNTFGRVISRPIEPSVPFDVWLLRPALQEPLRSVEDFITLLRQHLDSFAERFSHPLMHNQN